MAASDHLHPVQLKMFMTAPEIMAGYDPHEGDRQFRGSSRPVFAGQPHQVQTMGTAFGRKVYGPAPDLEPESNQDMWERKLAETKEVPDLGRSHYSRMEEGGGGIDNPIALTTHHYRGSHKPMLAGGHHRVAAMNEIDPERLLPVLHHENIISAQRDPNYRYT